MDPYKVLGVSPSASQEEIKAAYRELVKKYHPDKYTDETLKAQATEKIKEINAAYDMLTSKGSTGGSAGSSARQDYSRGYSGAYRGDYASEFMRVESLINRGRYEEALAILDAIPIKNARCNYLYGVISLKMSRYDAAASFFERAYTMEPDNVEYRNAYMRTNMNRASYSRTYEAPSGTRGSCLCGDDDCCTTCQMLICLNCLCEMCRT